MKIQNNLLEQIQLSDKDKFLIKLYLFEAFTTDSAVQLDLPKSDKSKLINDGYVVKEKLKFYLSKKGITESLFLIQTIDSIDFEHVFDS